ncbi:hypothetical protein [Advenella mimigardefordensis]|uniref:Putative membrane protein n=1 Tax=Advenella mimigardefordensis (strain DSM 17166 / LMG 22922 / DPN7) TaxID=1247726 RepID=W0PB00_ADVMD|nr:hypothetical protein [Advenella mimigardefordensis]AHG64044.1 putative membrane protein [Advenella mimigardefordensis DPN7]
MTWYLKSRVAAMSSLSVAVGVACALAAGVAHAEQSYCDSPWLAANTRLSGSVDGATARFSVLVNQVNRVSANQCTAQLTVDADAPIAGQRIQGTGPFTLTVEQGRSTLNGSFDASGLMNTLMKTSVQSALTGFFLKPANIVNPGDTLAPMSGQSNVNLTVTLQNGIPLNQINVSNASISTGPRKVGNLQSHETSVGTLQCMPVSYTATTSGGNLSGAPAGNGNATHSGTAQVTDWYCPEKGLTMESVVTRGSKKTRVVINSIQ